MLHSMRVLPGHHFFVFFPCLYPPLQLFHLFPLFRPHPCHLSSDHVPPPPGVTPSPPPVSFSCSPSSSSVTTPRHPPAVTQHDAVAPALFFLRRETGKNAFLATPLSCSCYFFLIHFFPFPFAPLFINLCTLSLERFAAILFFTTPSRLVIHSFCLLPFFPLSF